jgi:hypothetical protein
MAVSVARLRAPAAMVSSPARRSGYWLSAHPQVTGSDGDHPCDPRLAVMPHSEEPDRSQPADGGGDDQGQPPAAEAVIEDGGIGVQHPDPAEREGPGSHGCRQSGAAVAVGERGFVLPVGVGGEERRGQVAAGGDGERAAERGGGGNPGVEGVDVDRVRRHAAGGDGSGRSAEEERRQDRREGEGDAERAARPQSPD